MLRGFLALKSLVIGLAVLGLWGRSYFVGDVVRKGSATQYVQLGSAAGVAVVTFGHDGERTRLGGSWQYVATRSPREVLKEAGLGDTVWNRLGLGWNRQMLDAPARGMIVRVMLPHWLVFLLAIPSAVFWVVRRRKAQMARSRASFASEGGPLVCPKCGQLFGRVPASCPVFGQVLAAQEFL